jgi:hypothetical protein
MQVDKAERLVRPRLGPVFGSQNPMNAGAQATIDLKAGLKFYCNGEIEALPSFADITQLIPSRLM